MNTYQLILTQVSGGGGQFTGSGVVVFPYLNKALFAVDFNGIKVVGSPTQPGGCVTGGDVVVVGSNAGRLDGEVQARLAALYAKAQAGAQQDKFVGKLDEALQKLTEKATAIGQKEASGGKASKADLRELQTYLKALQRYQKAFDGDLQTVLGADSPLLAQARQRLDSLNTLAEGCNQCLQSEQTNPQRPEKGPNGQGWASCLEQTLQALIGYGNGVKKENAFMGAALFDQVAPIALKATTCPQASDPASQALLQTISTVTLDYGYLNLTRSETRTAAGTTYQYTKWYTDAGQTTEYAYYGDIYQNDSQYWLLRPKGQTAPTPRLWVRKYKNVWGTQYQYEVYFLNPGASAGGGGYCRADIERVPFGQTGGDRFADVTARTFALLSAGAVLAPLAVEAGSELVLEESMRQQWAKCGKGMALDLMVQSLVLSVLHPGQTPSEWVGELSLPNALISCGTEFLDNCGPGCQVLANGAAGVADDLLKQVGEGKGLSDIDYLRVLEGGTRQASISALGMMAVKGVGWLATKLAPFYKKYSKETVDDALLGIRTEIKSTKNLLNVTWKNNITGWKSSTDAITFWNTTDKTYLHFISGDFYIKLDNVTGNLLFGNHKTGELLGFYEGTVNATIINQNGLPAILNKLKIYHGVSGAPSYVVANVSSGARIITNPNKTATIVGNYTRYPYRVGDMKTLVGEELLGNLKTAQFGPKKGGFNVLNISDEAIGGDGGNFWVNFNEPWLMQAIERNDDIWAASNPLDLTLLHQNGPKIVKSFDDVKAFFNDPNLDVSKITGFGKEVKTLINNGYNYNYTTKMFVK